MAFVKGVILAIVVALAYWYLTRTDRDAAIEPEPPAAEEIAEMGPGPGIRTRPGETAKPPDERETRKVPDSASELGVEPGVEPGVGGLGDEEEAGPTVGAEVGRATGQEAEPEIALEVERAAGSIGRRIAPFEAEVAARLAAEPVPTEPLVGPIRIELTDVIWDDPAGRPFLQIDRVSALIDAGELVAGRVVAESVTVSAPDIVLERRAGEPAWNYERVLGGILAGDDDDGPGPAAAKPRVVLSDVRVDDGRIAISPAGPEAYLFESVEARLSLVALGAAGVSPEVRVTRLTTVATLTDLVAARPLTVEDASLLFPDGAVAFDIARIQVGGSVVTDAEGRWVFDAPGLGITAQLRVDPLLAEDARIFFPDLPDGVASFDLHIEPLAVGRTMLAFRNAVVEAGGSSVSGSLDLAIGGAAPPAILAVDVVLDPLTLALVEGVSGPLPYDGEVRGSVSGTAEALGFELVATLTAPEVPEPFDVALSGQVAFITGTLELNRLDVDVQRLPLVALRPLVPGIPFAGVVTGRVSLRGPPSVVPLAMDILLELEQGSATLAGTIDLTGDVPAYDLRGRLIAIDLQALFEPEIPPLTLYADYSLVGRGVSLAEAVAAINIAGRLTGWLTDPTDSLVVRATLDQGTLGLSTLRVEAGPVSLAAEGSWRFIAPAGGGLDYAIAIASIEAVAPYIPPLAGAVVAGELETVGRFTGTLAQPMVAGTLEAERLRYGSWSAESLAGSYDLVLGRPIEQVIVELDARELISPDGGVWTTASVDLDFRRPFFTLEATGGRLDEGRFELAARGRVEDDLLLAQLERLILDLEGHEWRLVRPAQLVLDPEGLDIRGLRIERIDAEGLVAVDGRLPPTLPADLRVQLRALPIEDVLMLAGIDPAISGILWLDARAIGPAESPVVDGEFVLLEATVGEVDVGRIEGTLQYAGQQLTALASVEFDTAQGAELRATIPLDLTLGLPPSFELFQDRTWRVAIVTDTLALETLAELTPELEDAEGFLQARIDVTGTPGQPVLTGWFQLWNGAVTVPALDQRYEEIRADIVLDGQVATIRELRARSDGWASATGTVSFVEITDPRLDLTVYLDEFRAIGVEDLRDAAVWGELRVAGPVSAPVVTGEVTFDDGNIRIPGTGTERLGLGGAGGSDPLLDDPFLTVSDNVLVPEPTPWFDAIILDQVIVVAGEDLWFVTDELRAQVSGELLLDKTPTEFRVFGTLEGDRGAFTLRLGPITRRFDIVSATVQFFGTPEPNPALDVTASRVIPGPGERRIEILMHIGGTLDAPTVAFTTADGATIPESEILSFLIFGQPSFALADAILPGESVLTETLFGVGGLAEVAVLELEELLLAGLGFPLDFIQLRPEPGTLIGVPTLVFGAEVADDLFLTVDAGLTTFLGAPEASTNAWTVTLEWRIDPEWTLVVGVAPVNRGRLFRGFGTALPVVTPDQQFIVELRRRWTY